MTTEELSLMLATLQSHGVAEITFHDNGSVAGVRMAFAVPPSAAGDDMQAEPGPLSNIKQAAQLLMDPRRRHNPEAD